MTDDLVMGALSQHSSIKFDGNSLDIDNVDSNSGTQEIVSDTKAAIKMALHEQGLDGQSKTNDSKKAVAQTNSTQNATVTPNETKNATLAQKEQGKEKKHHKKHNKDHKKKHHKKHHKKDAAPA